MSCSTTTATRWKSWASRRACSALIFGKAQNKFQDPAKLRRVIVDLIDAENWSAMGADVKGDAYEGLLEKNAQDTKSGAGQYFTPRALIQAMVDCIAPKPGETICDPACGTGGFLFTAHNYIVAAQPQPHPRREAPPQGRRLPRLGAGAGHRARVRDEPAAARHRLGEERARAGGRRAGGRPRRALRRGAGQSALRQEEQHDDRRRGRQDLHREGHRRARRLLGHHLSNKQLNFVQHIKTLLKPHGRAAVVVPDNVLFEGGAGETIRRKLLHECDVHTLLRLPTGLFYAQGVKANVLFFDKKPASETPWTQEALDLRPAHQQALHAEDQPAASARTWTSSCSCYNPANRHERKATWSAEKPDGRWRVYDYDELVARDKASLDIFWLQGRQPGRQRQPAAAGGDRAGDRRRPGGGAGAVPVDCRRIWPEKRPSDGSLRDASSGGRIGAGHAARSGPCCCVVHPRAEETRSTGEEIAAHRRPSAHAGPYAAGTTGRSPIRLGLRRHEPDGRSGLRAGLPVRDEPCHRACSLCMAVGRAGGTGFRDLRVPGAQAHSQLHPDGSVAPRSGCRNGRRAGARSAATPRRRGLP